MGSNANNSPIPAADIAVIRSFVEANGEVDTYTSLGCSKTGMYRILAGLPVYAGTHAIVREWKRLHPAGVR